MTEENKHPIDLSLRLWSDDIPLKPIVASLGVAADHLHLKGERMGETGLLANRVAKRHYASLASARGNDAADVADWLRRMSDRLASHPPLLDLLRAEKAEALFWIAILRGPLPTPSIDADLVTRVANLGARILLENYTEEADDLPTKTWLPSEPVPKTVA